jgi:hypothetical protein
VVKLTTDKDGYPILPSLKEIDGRGLLYKKQLIGKFLGDIYHRKLPIFTAEFRSLTGWFIVMSPNNGKKRVPWAELEKSQGDFVKRKYLPKQVALKQYHHIRRDDANAILKHWTERQSAGKVPFRFSKALWKNKDVPEENDADDDMLPREEAEEDRQDNDDSLLTSNGAPQGDVSSNGLAEQAHVDESLGNAAENPSRVSYLLNLNISRS